MTPYVNITFPCGRTYQVASAVAAAHFHAAIKADNPDMDDATITATVEAAFADDSRLFDYIKAMPWDAVEPECRLMNVQVSLEAEWGSAVLVSADAKMGYPKPTADRLLQQPMAVTLGALVQEGSDAQIGMITNAAGVPVAAVIVVQGSPDVVSGYVGVVDQFANFLSQRAAASGQTAATVQ